jgi:hypothetical protein
MKVFELSQFFEAELLPNSRSIGDMVVVVVSFGLRSGTQRRWLRAVCIPVTQLLGRGRAFPRTSDRIASSARRATPIARGWRSSCVDAQSVVAWA